MGEILERISQIEEMVQGRIDAGADVSRTERRFLDMLLRDLLDLRMEAYKLYLKDTERVQGDSNN